MTAGTPSPPAPGAQHIPDDAVEALVAAAFSAVLGVADVTNEDDFFVLGGHSLSAVQLVVHINELTGASLRVRDVFEASSVSSIAEMLRSEATPA